MAGSADPGSPTGLVRALRRWVDPVLASAGFGWNSATSGAEADARVVRVLYEADPVDFVHRYPRTHLPDSYGEGQWPPACVDLWLDFDRESRRVELDLEGFDVLDELRAAGRRDLAERITRLTPDADEDARVIATALAVVLGVPGPSPDPNP